MTFDQIKRNFEILDALVAQVQDAHKRGDITAQEATWIIHFVIKVDIRRLELVRQWNTN